MNLIWKKETKSFSISSVFTFEISTVFDTIDSFTSQRLRVAPISGDINQSRKAFYALDMLSLSRHSNAFSIWCVCVCVAAIDTR